MPRVSPIRNQLPLGHNEAKCRVHGAGGLYMAHYLDGYCHYMLGPIGVVARPGWASFGFDGVNTREGGWCGRLSGKFPVGE
jgi:hypothetical protein